VYVALFGRFLTDVEAVAPAKKKSKGEKRGPRQTTPKTTT
jgi:hypothetical protein